MRAFLKKIILWALDYKDVVIDPSELDKFIAENK